MHRVHFRPHNDEPTEEILNGRKALATQVADALASCQAPQVFGVDGDWGSGKTSFLCAVEKQITGHCHLPPKRKAPQPPTDYRHVRVVWFEAWRYQHEESPVVALLHEVCSQLGAVERSKKEIKKLAYAGFYGLINMLKEAKIGTSSSVPLKIEASIANPFHTIAAAGDQWEADHLAVPLTTEHTREILDKAIKALLGWSTRNNERVVIIVDDLDRCEPTATYRILEAVKIYLNLESCVFLLGLNQREVSRAVYQFLAN
jgi:hypothetical protein